MAASFSIACEEARVTEALANTPRREPEPKPHAIPFSHRQPKQSPCYHAEFATQISRDTRDPTQRKIRDPSSRRTRDPATQNPRLPNRPSRGNEPHPPRPLTRSFRFSPANCAFHSRPQQLATGSRGSIMTLSF